MAKKLGKGINALFSDNLDKAIAGLADSAVGENNNSETLSEGATLELNIKDIAKAKDQGRSDFHEEAIDALAESIREHGIIQPLVVRKYNSKYQLIAGERRLRAAKKAGLKKVPVILMEAGDEKAAEIGMIENLQRENLNPLEEAAAYSQMMESYGYTQDSLSKALGKSRSYIANTLRLLALDEETKAHIKAGELSPGHGRAILSLKAEPRRKQLREEIIKNHLSVRQAEDRAKALGSLKEDTPKSSSDNKQAKSLYPAYEKQLRNYLQTKIAIKSHKIEVSYGSKDELERILALLLPEEK